MARPGSRRALRRHERARLIAARTRQCRDLGAADWLDVREPGRLARVSLFRMCSCGLCSPQDDPRSRPAPGWWDEQDGDLRWPPR